MKGRKPTPTALHVLRGNPGKRRRNPREPRPPPLEALEAPAWLDPAAREEWLRLAPLLGQLGVVTATDVDALAAYCEAWTTWKQATRKLRQNGLVVTTGDGDPVVSPYVKIAHNAMAHCARLLVELGMTPSARARVQVRPEGPTKAASKWQGLL